MARQLRGRKFKQIDRKKKRGREEMPAITICMVKKQDVEVPGGCFHPPLILTHLFLFLVPPAWHNDQSVFYLHIVKRLVIYPSVVFDAVED
ncbi:hypothetical protein STEG23_037728 [Scotinomys teguina]